MLKASNKYVITAFNKPYTTLTIVNFNTYDVGLYSCKGTNYISNEMDTITLNVQSESVHFLEFLKCSDSILAVPRKTNLIMFRFLDEYIFLIVFLYRLLYKYTNMNYRTIT